MLKNTGIGINFGTTILLGFVVGMAIAGQTFYLFTVEDLRHFGALKAMGASTARLARMILSQSIYGGDHRLWGRRRLGHCLRVFDGKRRATLLVAESAGQNPDLTRLRAMELHRMEVLTGASPGSVLLQPKSLRTVIVQPEIPVGLPSQLLGRRPDFSRQNPPSWPPMPGSGKRDFFPTPSITGQGGITERRVRELVHGKQCKLWYRPVCDLAYLPGRHERGPFGCGPSTVSANVGKLPTNHSPRFFAKSRICSCRFRRVVSNSRANASRWLRPPRPSASQMCDTAKDW